ncbi:MAG: methyltransferase domain-containing protein [Anaerolineae bacterium]|nr:methyltransferase domain-containing protein [Anaerolineae bacterium]
MAFDALAPTYDQTFTDTQIARWLRGRVHARFHHLWQPGNHVLELGCGTGEDARHLAGQGIRVTATDGSEKMLQVARDKNQHTPLAEFRHLDLNRLPATDFMDNYDGVVANFGVINCVNDLSDLADWLAPRVKIGGRIAFGVMSPWCLWEIAWNAAHLDFSTATRRIRGGSTFRSNETEIRVHYPSPRRLRQRFSSYFRQTHLEGLGILLPPSGAYGVIEKRPRWLGLLTNLESRIAGYERLARFADHYWIELIRE